MLCYKCHVCVLCMSYSPDFAPGHRSSCGCWRSLRRCDTPGCLAPCSSSASSSWAPGSEAALLRCPGSCPESGPRSSGGPWRSFFLPQGFLLLSTEILALSHSEVSGASFEYSGVEDYCSCGDCVAPSCQDY